MECDYMALFPDDTMRKDGIQLGGPQTLCYKCELLRRANDPDSDIPYGKLEYKEVFKMIQHGQDTCLCMDHFREMCATSHYALIDTNECIAVPITAMEEQESEPEKVKDEQAIEEVQQEEEKPKKKQNKKKEEGDK